MILYGCIACFFGAIEMWRNLFAYNLRFRLILLAISGWGKEQRLFIHSIVSNLRITTGVCPVIHVHHGCMHTLVRVAILWLRCLHAFIFRLKSAYVPPMLIRLCLLPIMSLIALFKSKYALHEVKIIALLSNRIKEGAGNAPTVLRKMWL